MNIVQKFKQSPSRDYSLGIAATWAGAGSLIVGMAMVQNYGVVPFLLWALGNILACIVFGLLANRYEYLRKVFTSKGAKLVIGFMCIFQLWVNMSGVHDSLTVISPQFAVAFTYIVAIVFLFLYLRFAMIKNVLTDSVGWKFVYILIFALGAFSIAFNGIDVPTMGMTDEGLMQGVTKCIALIPGAFFYPCFWALFDYNEKNKDEVNKVDMKMCFVKGGLLFGIYLAFVFVLGITSFTPELEIVKGILLALIAMSSLTSFIYSIYISFGNKVGFAVNAFALAGWYYLIPLGVMGAWTLMADFRLVMVIIAIGIAIGWKLYDEQKAVKE